MAFEMQGWHLEDLPEFHLDTLHDGVDLGVLVPHKLRPFIIEVIDQMKGLLIDWYLELIKSLVILKKLNTVNGFPTILKNRVFEKRVFWEKNIGKTLQNVH